MSTTLKMKYASLTNYIGGKNVKSSSKRTLEVLSPIDGSLLSTVPMSTVKDLNAAVAAAKAAFDTPCSPPRCGSPLPSSLRWRKLTEGKLNPPARGIAR